MIFDFELKYLENVCVSDSDRKEWARIRASVLRSLAEAFQYSTQTIRQPSIKVQLKLKMISATLISFFSIIKHFISPNQKYDFVLLTTTKNHESIDDSSYLFKDFINCNKCKKILLVGAFTGYLKSDKNLDFLNIYLIRYFLFIIKIWAKFYSIINKPKTYKNMVKVLEVEELVHINHRKLRETIIRVNHEATLLKLFLYNFLKLNSRISKVIVFEDGFMSQNSKFINALNENDVETVEYQHGAIYPGHEAYNAHNRAVSVIAKQNITPKTLWSFSKSWSNNCNLCQSCVSIGIPWYNNVLLKYDKPLKTRRILIISDGIDTSEYLKIAGEVSTKLMSYNSDDVDLLEVNVRLHPSDDKLNYLNVAQISPIIDVWEDLYRSDIIVACVSTCLYQADFLGKKSIIWLNRRAQSAYGDLEPFDGVRNVSDLTQLIIDFYNSTNFKVEKNRKYFSPFVAEKLLSK